MKKVFFILMILLINGYADESFKSFPINKAYESFLPNEIVQCNDTTITDLSIIKMLQDKNDPKDIKCIIINGSFLTDKGISNIAKYCPNLEMLDLQGDYITDLGVEIISLNCPCLRFLSLDATNHGLISDTGLSFLINNSKKLKGLSLCNHYNITKLGFKSFEEKLNLEFSCFSYNTAFDYDEEEQLIELNGFGCDDEKLLEIIKNVPFPSLIKKIYISFEPLLSEKAIFYIAENCPNLTSLLISNNILTDEGLLALSQNCKNLEVFEGSLSNSKVTIQGLLTFAESCPNLISLDLTLSNSGIKNEDISNLIKKLPLLEGIYLTGNISIQDQIKILNIDLNDKYNKQEIERFEKLEGNLQSAPSLLTDKDILNIAKNCPKLRIIDFKYNPEITCLSIMQLLKSCPNLSQLYLYGTSITKEDVDRILELYPNIDIEYGIFPNKIENNF
ncbi:MAG: hypothetical protein WCT85_00285 [Parachlamydiales bacterium]|jgi:hypothetical protein